MLSITLTSQGKIVGYAQDFCNKKLKENQNTIPVLAHNLFRFDFSFVVKGLRLCVWRTKNLNIGGRNLTDVQYANIGNQVKFIDTTKFYQQSLSSLAADADSEEKSAIKASCEKFIRNHKVLTQNFAILTKDEKEWVLRYISSGEGVILYKTIRQYKDLDLAPCKEFFAKTKFYSTLRNGSISDKDYKNVKKLWCFLRLRKLSDLNDLYNFQDTIILC